MLNVQEGIHIPATCRGHGAHSACALPLYTLWLLIECINPTIKLLSYRSVIFRTKLNDETNFNNHGVC
jgi:hypothetical protein